LILLDEPLLIFGGPTAARDPKAGLSLAGPAGLDDIKSHPAQIDIALVGTGSTIEMAQRWIEECGGPIGGDPRNPGRFPIFRDSAQRRLSKASI
jgi:hypothetical protein